MMNHDCLQGTALKSRSPAVKICLLLALLFTLMSPGVAQPANPVREKPYAGTWRGADGDILILGEDLREDATGEIHADCLSTFFYTRNGCTVYGNIAIDYTSRDETKPTRLAFHPRLVETTNGPFKIDDMPPYVFVPDKITPPSITISFSGNSMEFSYTAYKIVNGDGQFYKRVDKFVKTAPRKFFAPDMKKGYTRTFETEWTLNHFIKTAFKETASPYRPVDTTPRPVIAKSHTGDIIGLEYSPDGTLIATAAQDRKIKIWDAKSGTLLRTIMEKGVILKIGFHRDGKQLFCESGYGDEDHKNRTRILNLWRIEDGALIHSYVWTGKADIGFSRDGAAVIVNAGWRIPADPDNYILIDHSGRLLPDSSHHNLLVLSALQRHQYSGVEEFLRGNRTFLDGSSGIFDQRSGKKLERHTDKSFNRYNSLALSPDETLLAHGGHDGSVTVYTMSDFSPVALYSGLFTRAESCAVSPDNRYVAAGAEGGLGIWRIKDRALVHYIQGLVGPVTGLEFSPDGSSLAVASNGYSRKSNPDRNTYRVQGTLSKNDTEFKLYPVEVRMYSVVTGELEKTIQGNIPRRDMTLALDPAHRILTGEFYKDIHIWDLKNLKNLLTIEHGEYFNPHNKYHKDYKVVAFSADGRYAASLGFDKATKYVKVWDAASGKRLFLHPTEEGVKGYPNLAFSPDDTLLFVNQRWYRVSDWKQMKPPLPMGNTCLSFTPDGRYLAMGDALGHNRGPVALWDVKNARLARPVGNHPDDVYAVGVKPDGTQIVSGDGTGTLKFWDVNTSVQQFSVNAHSLPVKTIRYAPDGSYVASASMDGTIKLWNPKNARLIKSLEVDPGGVNDMRIAAEGNTIVAAAADGSKWFWNVKTGRTAIVVHFGEQACVIDDQNRVDCTPGAEKYFQIMSGVKVLDRNKYWKKFYTPGLLARVMAGK